MSGGSSWTSLPQWVNLSPYGSAQVRLSEIRAGLDQSHFAWHGEASRSGSTYFRIQGPAVIIEFSTQEALGSNAFHYHSIYRDPANDYGSTALH